MNKLVQLVPPPDKLKEAFFKKVASDYESREALFGLLHLLGDFRDAPDSTVFISKLLSDWLRDESNDLNESRHAVQNLVRHLSFFKQL